MRTPPKLWDYRSNPAYLGFIITVALLCLAERQTDLQAQTVINLSDSVTCQPCSITFDTVAVIGDARGLGAVQEQSRISMGPNGHIYLTSNWNPGIVKVFDSNGNFVNQFGQLGRNVGEYTVPTVHPAEHVIHVLDRHRITALTPEFAVLGVKEMPFRASLIERLDKQRFVVFAVPMTPEHIGIPFHVYDYGEGSITHSFGASRNAVTVLDRGSAGRRAIAVGTQGTLWTSPWNQYRIEQWDLNSGTLESVMQREVEWFVPWNVPRRGTVLTRPPETMLWRLSAGADDILWALFHTAADDWRPRAPARTEGSHEYISDAQYNEIYDSILEGIAVGGGQSRLYISKRLPGRILGFAAPGVVYVYRADGEEKPQYVLLRLRIVS